MRVPDASDAHDADLPDGVFFYSGPSMNPTLRPKDVLHVRQVDVSEVRAGDVIVFNSPVGDGLVVHRVVSIDARGRLTTRGDSNLKPDDWLLEGSQVVGLVTHVNRGNRSFCVSRGLGGMIRARTVHARNLVVAGVHALLRGPFRWMVARRIPARWLSGWIPTRVVRYGRGAEVSELHLYLGRRMIGRLPHGHQQWQIPAVYRLIVDESALDTRGS